MKRIKLIWSLLLFLLFGSIVFMFNSEVYATASVTNRTAATSTDDAYTAVHKDDNWMDRLQIVVWDWESGAGGNCSGGAVTGITGMLWQAIFIPASGARAPENLYDVTVYTARSSGEDFINTAGANCSGTSVDRRTPLDALNDAYIWAIYDTLYLSVTNAGADNRGTVILIFKLP